MSNYQWGVRSRERMVGLHPHLKILLGFAIGRLTNDATVIEGKRSMERQKELVDTGASRTMNSRHLLRMPDSRAPIRTNFPVAHAVDLAVLVNGEVSWEFDLYRQMANEIKEVAAELDIPVEWGGDWRRFKDGPHFQLPWKPYSIAKS